MDPWTRAHALMVRLSVSQVLREGHEVYAETKERLHVFHEAAEKVRRPLAPLALRPEALGAATTGATIGRGGTSRAFV